MHNFVDFFSYGKHPFIPSHYSHDHTNSEDTQNRAVSVEQLHNLDISELRNLLNSLKTRLKTADFPGQLTGDFSGQLWIAYRDTYLALLSKEFERPQEIQDEKSLGVWKQLIEAIRFEDDPQSFIGKESFGCSHTYFATALLSYVRALSATLFSDFRMVESDKTVLEVFFRTMERLIGLLENYLRIAATINGMKYLATVEVNYAELLENLLSNEDLANLQNFGELLFPLGWLMPREFKGHLILGKLNYNPNDNRCMVKIFDSTAFKAGEDVSKLAERRINKSAITLMVHKKTPPESVLNNVYSLLPLQIPAHFERFENNGKSATKRMEETAAKAIYLVMGKDGDIIDDRSKSPLSKSLFVPGKTCVPNAFRMLIYTLAREETINLTLEKHDALKYLCDILLKEFKNQVLRTFAPVWVGRRLIPHRSM
jgi:hypothetical protein